MNGYNYFLLQLPIHDHSLGQEMAQYGWMRCDVVEQRTHCLVAPIGNFITVFTLKMQVLSAPVSSVFV